MSQVELAIIGGSGVYNIEKINIVEQISIKTPFGYPSDRIAIGNVKNKLVAFLPRHAKGHTILPSEVPSRANIYALKSLGVKTIISISAVGSLKEEIAPKDFIIPNQLIDMTKYRESSFFGKGIVGHVSFADPFCKTLSDYLYNTIKSENIVNIHKDETYLCIDGPLFSTKAESNLYKSWGCGIIGMTAVPEAKLAREAEICYATIAMSTDYDCWHKDHENVTINMILENMNANVNNIKSFLIDLISNIPNLKSCSCRKAVDNAIITDSSLLNKNIKDRLEVLYDKYL